nr:reverse transcriptase family protein [Candidatus Sigynarchaeota archaeon]
AVTNEPCTSCGLQVTRDLTVIIPPHHHKFPCHVDDRYRILGDGSCPYHAFYLQEYTKARKQGIHETEQINQLVKKAWHASKKTFLKTIVKKGRYMGIFSRFLRTSFLPLIHEHDFFPVFGITGQDLARLKCMSHATVPDDAYHALPYRHIQIPKRGGGTRDIYSPDPWLGSVQEKILRGILECVQPHHACHGFRKYHSVVTNARQHAFSKVIWKVDLKDFFPSITHAQIMRVFLEIGYSQPVASILANACAMFPRVRAGKVLSAAPSRPPFLPQGACTSPALSNLVLINIDARLDAIANDNHFRYSRYADDLVFSSKRYKTVPKSFMRDIRSTIEENGFHVNPHKLAIATRHTKQVVTGILVNNGCALPRPWLRKLRSALHHLSRGDYDSLDDLAYVDMLKNIEGRVSYALMVNSTAYLFFQQKLDRYKETLGIRRMVAMLKNGTRQRHLDDFVVLVR